IVMSVAVLIACNTDNSQGPATPATLEEVPKPNDNVVFQAYEVPPEPKGGYRAIQEAIQYPKIAREAGIQGTVIVQAVIDTSGVAKDPVVLRGVDEMLDLAALEAIVRVEWNPAQKAGELVAVKISVPIVFKLKTD
ncbi:MAG: energy transducer TonB, partial [Candidatus Marinimicrobia bacterium]|nr:energy transducer TonB [Candidatus Neomarinimicrobiota bacterium]